jgi:hypothetical protein
MSSSKDFENVETKKKIGEIKTILKGGDVDTASFCTQDMCKKYVSQFP